MINVNWVFFHFLVLLLGLSELDNKTCLRSYFWKEGRKLSSTMHTECHRNLVLSTHSVIFYQHFCYKICYYPSTSQLFQRVMNDEMILKIKSDLILIWLFDFYIIKIIKNTIIFEQCNKFYKNFWKFEWTNQEQ